jgi:hypothetical protein
MTQKRFLMLWFGIFMTAFSVVMSFTPLHWYIEKLIRVVPDEYYPELTWLMLILPISVAVLLLGAAIAFKANIQKLFTVKNKPLNGVL